MKIYIRVDASIKIGTGHVMRCLTLASALSQRGANVEFLCRELEGNLIEYIGEKGFVVNVLSNEKSAAIDSEIEHAAWLETSWQEDAQQCAAIARDADWLVVDHYALDKNWQAKMRGSAKKIFVIDDLADRQHDCDSMLDQNYYTDMKMRYDALLPSGCRKILGPKFALLRTEFLVARAACEVRESVKNILIFFGGVDADDHTAKAAKMLVEQDEYNVDIVVGGAYKNYDKLNNIIKLNPRLKLHRQVFNMAELMANADLAVGSGGSTSWERCALGLPTLGWPIADNQVQVIENLVALGVFKIASAEKLLDRIDNINSDELASMSKKAFSVCDAKGANIVTNHIMLNVREARMSDAEEILQIRNQEVVRRFAFDDSIIELDTHLAWFEKILANENRVLLVAEVDNKIAGVLRYDIDDDEAEISIYLNPDHFGFGYSKTLLHKGEQFLEENGFEVSLLVAEIKDENELSKSLFVSDGYVNKDNRYIKRI